MDLPRFAPKAEPQLLSGIYQTTKHCGMKIFVAVLMQYSLVPPTSLLKSKQKGRAMPDQIISYTKISQFCQQNFWRTEIGGYKSKEQYAGKIGKFSLEKCLSESCSLPYLTLQRWKHLNRIVINFAHMKTAERLQSCVLNQKHSYVDNEQNIEQNG